MRNRSRGFTLVEMLVVIAIIGFLAATLVVAAMGMKRRAMVEKATKLVQGIDAACEAYFTKFQDYPSAEAKLTAADKALGHAWTPIVHDDAFLFDYLGRPLTAVVAFGPGAGKTATLEPFLEFPASELAGPAGTPHAVRILDPWGGAVFYDLPGHAHGPGDLDMSIGPSSSTNSRFDLTSPGPDGGAESFGGPLVDDVTNWRN